MVTGTPHRIRTITQGQAASVAACLILAIGVGTISVVSPVAALVIAAGLILLGLISLGERLGIVFLVWLGFILFGYAFFGRGFAYIGAPPLFVGEIGLGLAVLALLAHVRRWRISVLELLIVLFMLLGAVRTLPYLATYDIDALRDAVVWGYAIFALAVSILIRRENIETIISWYKALVPVFIIWTPIALLLAATGGLVQVPISGTALLTPRAGEWAVHLAGSAAFVLLGLWGYRTLTGAAEVSDRSESPARGIVRTSENPESTQWSQSANAAEHRSGWSVAEIGLWIAWGTALILVASMNRGAMVAIMAAVAVSLLIRPSRHLLRGIVAALLVLIPLLWFEPTVELEGHHRELSVTQLSNNIQSLWDGSRDQGLYGTQEWRTNWWSDIVDYTVHGPYRWTGKGFGINLADDDGYQVTADGSLRSPHSGHLTILARMGLPGVAIWLALSAAFAGSLLVSAYRARHRGDRFWFAVLVWIFSYWIAMMANASFDVYLEGPQGGIWFWSIIGLGMAASRLSNVNSQDKHGQER